MQVARMRRLDWHGAPIGDGQRREKLGAEAGSVSPEAAGMTGYRDEEGGMPGGMSTKRVGVFRRV